MTGIEKIKSEILEDAKKQAAEIQNEGTRKALEQKELFEKEAENIYNQILSQAKTEAQKLEDVRIPTAALEGKKLVLKAKNEIIHQVIKDALSNILSLPDEQYYQLISYLIDAHSKPGQKGELLFNQKDLVRLPKLFALKSSIKSYIDGKKLTISKETRDIRGGFVLRYGNIEENCSFEALFAEREEELFDFVNKLLFAHNEGR